MYWQIHKTSFLHIENEAQLKGLPPSAIEMAKAVAEQKQKKGWVFTLDYPSYVPFMTYAEDRELRKKMSLAFGKRGFQDNPNNNVNTILEIVKLRHERATLLGYESHAAFVLEERMAKTAKEVPTVFRRFEQKKQSLPPKENGKLMQSFARDRI